MLELAAIDVHDGDAAAHEGLLSLSGRGVQCVTHILGFDWNLGPEYDQVSTTDNWSVHQADCGFANFLYRLP